MWLRATLAQPALAVKLTVVEVARLLPVLSMKQTNHTVVNCESVCAGSDFCLVSIVVIKQTCLRSYKSIFNCVHTEIALHGRIKGSSINRLCFCFYFTHRTSGVSILPRLCAITHSVLAFYTQIFTLDDSVNLYVMSAFPTTFTVPEDHQLTLSRGEELFDLTLFPICHDFSLYTSYL